MNLCNKARIAAAALLSLAALAMNAQRGPHHRSLRHKCRSHVVLVRNVHVTNVIHRFSQKERLAMAIAFLKENECISAKQYGRITGLKREAAQAELDAFAADKRTPIYRLIDNKKKTYALKHGA